MDEEKLKNILFYLFWIVFCLGSILFLNRYFYSFLPNTNWRVLSDHLFAGFLVTLLFYIFLLGIFSFFYPNRKIEYKLGWFIFSSSVVIIISLLWEGVIQKFRDIDQLIMDYLGLYLSWIYFLVFRKASLIINSKAK